MSNLKMDLIDTNRIMTTKNIKMLNEVIDKKMYIYGTLSQGAFIAVEKTRQAVRNELKLRFFKREISERQYLDLCDLNEIIANVYRYM